MVEAWLRRDHTHTLADPANVTLIDALPSFLNRTLGGAPEQPGYPPGHAVTVLKESLDHWNLNQ
jgi:hypothetical protein